MEMKDENIRLSENNNGKVGKKMEKQKKKKIRRKILFVLVSLLLINSCPITQEIGITQETKAATVKLNKKSVTVKQKKSCTLKLKGTSKAAKWSVPKDYRETIRIKKIKKNTYKVTGLKPGTGYVVAKVGKKSYKCKVTVSGVSGSTTLNVGQTRTYTLYGGSKAFTWKVEGTGIVLASSAKGTKVRLTAVSTGTAKITVTGKVKGKKYTFKKTVKSVKGSITEATTESSTESASNDTPNSSDTVVTPTPTPTPKPSTTTTESTTGTTTNSTTTTESTTGTTTNSTTTTESTTGTTTNSTTEDTTEATTESSTSTTESVSENGWWDCVSGVNLDGYSSRKNITSGDYITLTCKSTYIPYIKVYHKADNLSIGYSIKSNNSFISTSNPNNLPTDKTTSDVTYSYLSFDPCMIGTSFTFTLYAYLNGSLEGSCDVTVVFDSSWEADSLGMTVDEASYFNQWLVRSIECTSGTTLERITQLKVMLCSYIMSYESYVNGQVYEYAYGYATNCATCELTMEYLLNKLALEDPKLTYWKVNDASDYGLSNHVDTLYVYDGVTYRVDAYAGGTPTEGTTGYYGNDTWGMKEYMNKFISGELSWTGLKSILNEKKGIS